MKDEEVKVEEIEDSYTLCGSVIHTEIRQSHGLVVYYLLFVMNR